MCIYWGSGFSGMEWWTGMLEWNGELECWNGTVEWNGGILYQTFPTGFRHNQKACHK